jgi:hypothetical protein
MPGKPFYSLEEASAKLGKTTEQVKGLVRDGTLREFRDAGKVFFKAEDIKRLAGPKGTAADSGEILLEPAGEGVPADGLPDVGEDTSGGTSIIGLEPLPEEETEEKKQGTAVAAKGIGVFDDDELDSDSDPMAKTQITTGATDDQVSLEGAGSGSGLLDLAREADDTALGADLLDEIYPGEEAAPAPAEKPRVKEASGVEPAPEGAEVEPTAEPVLEEAAAEGEVLLPAGVSAGDPTEGMFSGLLVGAMLLMALACSIVGSVVQGYLPDYGRFLGEGSTFFFFLGGAVLLAAITLLAGWFLGKAFNPRRRT